MYKNDAQKVRTPESRLSYCHLFQPNAAMSGGDPKYSVTVLIDKSNAAAYNDIQQAIAAAREVGLRDKWKGAAPVDLGVPLYDGDGVMPSSGEPWDEECKGHWVLRCSCKSRPQVIDITRGGQPANDDDVYAGCYGVVTVRFYPYSTNGKKGVSCGLGNVAKTRDGEMLGGRSSADADFGDLIRLYPRLPFANMQLGLK